MIRASHAIYAGAALIAAIAVALFLQTPRSAVEPSVQDSAAQKVFNAQSYTLENGLQIIVVPNHRAPVITHMVWYRVGAADEPRGKSGIAHFLEHLMFKGSDGLAPGEFSETVRALGGNDNAFTSQDYTAYFQSIASEHLETVMKMEAGRMRGLAPPEEQVLSERQVILEERRQRTDNSPAARLNEQIDATLFINHPYGTPVIGWMHEMAELSWSDAKSFYDRWYGPNNAILIVSGDVTGAQVYELAQKIYGPLTKINVPERNWAKSPPLKAASTVTMTDASIKQPNIQTVFRTPSARINQNEALALEVMEEIVGGGATGRLYKALVVDQKIASSAGISYRPQYWDEAQTTLYATPLPGIELDTVKTAYENELRRLIKDGVTNKELEEAKSRMQDAAIYARDSLTGPAMVFGYSLITGSSIDDIEYWPQNIARVTAEQIQNVAKKYLDPDGDYETPPITGYLLPEAPQAIAPSKEGSE